MSQTRDQSRKWQLIGWHEPLVPQRIMIMIITWPSIARANGQLELALYSIIIIIIIQHLYSAIMSYADTEALGSTPDSIAN